MGDTFFSPLWFSGKEDLTYKNRYGDEYTVPSGETITFDDVTKPCAALDHIKATTDAGDFFSGDVDTQNALYLAQVNCEGLSGPTIDVVAPPGEPSIADPSATGTDEPPPAGEESASLNAPAPEPNASASFETRPPGVSDGRPLAQQYYDPGNPMPDYDVHDILAEQELSPEELEKAWKDVLRNGPPPRQPHRDFSSIRAPRPGTAGDPVILFTGQYSLSVTDVAIRCRGLPLQLTRVYRSGPVYFGPWGYNWDHNYNVYLRELDGGGAAIWGGNLGEEIYRLEPDGTFSPPIGVFRKLDREFDGGSQSTVRYILSDREGMRQIFFTPEGWPSPDRVPLKRIEDRHGNGHELQYDSAGRLTLVGDDAGRFLLLQYGDCGLLESVEDHTKRRWRYVHDDDIEHLAAVVSPGTAQYPDGLMSRYQYDTAPDHPLLVHNLVRVIDAAGQIVVENTYGDDPGTDDFGRVVYQSYGGYEAVYEATRLQYVPNIPEALNTAALQVQTIDPGVLHIFTFNYRGDLLDHRFRLIRDGSYRLVARTYRYDEQGNLVERREPNGLGELCTFDAENEDPRARGNLLNRELVSPPSAVAPSRIVQEFTYEPVFHRIKTHVDERKQVTTFVYDYEEMLGNHGDFIRINYPVAALPDGSPQPRSEHFSYNAFGQITEHITGAKHRHTFAYEGSGSKAGYLTALTLDIDGAAQTQSFEYDEHGHRSAVVDGLTNRVETDTNVLDQVTAFRLPVVDGSVAESRLFYSPGGQVAREELPRGTYDDAVMSDSFIANEYSYDVLGHLTEAIYAANSAFPRRYRYEHDDAGRILSVTDPMLARTVLSYDERGLLLSRRVAAGLPEETVTRYAYHRNGDLARVDSATGAVTVIELDPWDRVKRIGISNGSEQRFAWGATDRLEETWVAGDPGDGTPERDLTRARFEYDDRGRPVRFIMLSYPHPVEAVELITEYGHDPDGRLTSIKQPRGGMRQYEYDGLDRIVRTEDVFGNVRHQEYDSVGNIVLTKNEEVETEGIRTSEWTFVPDARGRVRMIVPPGGAATEFVYDDRGLVIERREPLGLTIRLRRGLLGEIEEQVLDPSGLAIQLRYDHDLLGRLSRVTDPMGEVTIWNRDILGRPLTVQLPDKSKWSSTYQAAGLSMTQTTPAGSHLVYEYGSDTGRLTKLSCTPGIGVESVATHEFHYDGLGRLVRAALPLHMVERQYDSLGRVIGERVEGKATEIQYDDLAGTVDVTYPDGRVERTTTDVGGRPLDVSVLVPGALDAEVATIATFTYAGAERIQKVVYGNGVETSVAYDDQVRVVGIDHMTGAGTVESCRYRYDARDRRRVSQLLGTLEMTRLNVFDARDRLVEARWAFPFPPLLEPSIESDQGQDQDIAAAEVASETAGQWELYLLDGADSRIERIRFDGTTTDDTLYSYMSGHRANGAGAETIGYHPDGPRAWDGPYLYDIDALGRIVRVRDKATLALLGEFAYDALGRSASGSLAGEPFARWFLGQTWIHEEDDGGQVIRQQSLHPFWPVPIATRSAGGSTVPHPDGTLSTLCVTNASGAVVERMRFTPFGEPAIFAADGTTVVPSTSGSSEPIFGGLRYVPRLGLYSSARRLYDPRHGLFLTRDPFLYADSPSPYLYAIHNPTDFVDPNGMEAEKPQSVRTPAASAKREIGFWERVDKSRAMAIQRAAMTSLANIPNTLWAGLTYVSAGLTGHITPSEDEVGRTTFLLDEEAQQALQETASWRIEPPPGSEELSARYDVVLPLVLAATFGGNPKPGIGPPAGALFAHSEEPVAVLGAVPEELVTGAPILGKPQAPRGTPPPPAPGHAQTSLRIAQEFARVDDTALHAELVAAGLDAERVTLNLSWRNMTAGEVGSLQRPDVGLVTKSGGFTSVEVPSPSDLRGGMFGKLIAKNLKVMRGVGPKSEGLFIIWSQ